MLLGFICKLLYKHCLSLELCFFVLQRFNILTTTVHVVREMVWSFTSLTTMIMPLELEDGVAVVDLPSYVFAFSAGFPVAYPHTGVTSEKESHLGNINFPAIV